MDVPPVSPRGAFSGSEEPRSVTLPVQGKSGPRPSGRLKAWYRSRRSATSYDALFLLPDRPAEGGKPSERPFRKAALSTAACAETPCGRNGRFRPDAEYACARRRKNAVRSRKGNGRRFMGRSGKHFPLHMVSFAFPKAERRGKQAESDVCRLCPENTTDADRQSPRAAASRSPPRLRAPLHSPARARRQAPETSSAHCCTGGRKALPP